MITLLDFWLYSVLTLRQTSCLQLSILIVVLFSVISLSQPTTYFHDAKFSKLLKQHLFLPVWCFMSNYLRSNQIQLLPLMANLSSSEDEKFQFASLVIVFVSKQTSLSSYPPLILSVFYPLITTARPVRERICLLLVSSTHYTTYISICANAFPRSLTLSVSLVLWAPCAVAAVRVAPSRSRKLRLLSLWIKETERLSRLSPSMRIRYCHLLSAVISFASPWQTLWGRRPP